MRKSLWIVITMVAMLGFFGISAAVSYNNLVNLREDVNSKWSQIDNQLQRRADLVPNMVNTEQSYATH